MKIVLKHLENDTAIEEGQRQKIRQIEDRIDSIPCRANYFAPGRFEEYD